MACGSLALPEQCAALVAAHTDRGDAARHDHVEFDGGGTTGRMVFGSAFTVRVSKVRGDHYDQRDSRRDITNIWPMLEGKLHVIPHGINDSYLQESIGPPCEQLREIGVNRPYLLYMGGSNPRKRLDWAVRVLGELADPSVSLVACGVDKTTQERIRQTMREELRPQVCFAPFVAEEQMPALYQNAVAVLYPTLYEGFGFPALEAQAVGTPVLFSALGSLAELQGPGAVVLPPHDLDAWVGVCRQLVAQRGELTIPDQGSRRWAKGFSWDVCAQRHFEIYRMAAADRGHDGRAQKP